jgi:hypothetical protein
MTCFHRGNQKQVFKKDLRTTQPQNGWTLQNYLRGVMLHVSETAAPYESLFWPGVPWHPIPFSGDVLGARVLTVGINPSASEFRSRSAPVENDSFALEQHLVKYFTREGHAWFDTWSKALGSLGMSYQNGAAHLDLSPRATRSMGSFKDPKGATLFTEMLETDVCKFFELLTHCRSARALLLAGCSPKRYVSDFLMRVAPRHGFRLDLEGHVQQRNEGRAGFYRLYGPTGVELPVFFCSVSPSARKNKNLLVERVSAHRERISSWLH